MKIRYIRDWSNGNTNGVNNNWNEICAYDYNNANIALGKTVTPSKVGTNDASVVTDGSDNVAFTFSGLGNVVVDLGGIYDIDRIRIRRFFPNGNTTTQYHETKTEVSINGQDWVTVFDCVVDGKYYETSEGKIINLKKDIDKLEDSATLKDVKNKVTEIENSLQDTKDYFKNVLTDKDIECSDTDGMLNLINKVKDISIGKKWVIGEGTTGTTTYYFNDLDGSTVGMTYFDISNLDFIPSTIIYIASNNSVGYGILTNLNQYYSNIYPEYIQFASMQPRTSITSSVYCVRADEKVFINNSTVRLPSNTQRSTYSWIAFE